MRGRLIRWGLPLVLVAFAGVGAAMAASSASQAKATLRGVKSGSFGTILVGPSGKTLYRYTLDRKRVNRCNSDATCAKYWPRLLVKGNTRPKVGAGLKASLVGTIKATGTMRQVTYAGWPLYYFAGDKKAGQTTGQNFQSEWYVVNTKGAFVKHTVSAAPAPAPPTTTGSTGGGGDVWG